MKISPAIVSGGFGKSFKGLLDSLELSDNLLLCLDAGFRGSFDPTVNDQIWFDLSGNGHNWYRGNTSSASTADPTFNGTAGNMSENEYWSFDGGDYFTQVTEDFFAKPLHSDGGQGTTIAIASVGDTDDGFVVFFGGGPTQSSNDIVHGYRFNMAAHSLDTGGSFDDTYIGMSAGFGTASGAFGQYNYTVQSTVSRPSITTDTMYFAAAAHADEGNLYVYYNKTQYADEAGGNNKNLTAVDPTISRPYFIGSSYINAGQRFASAGSKLWCLAVFDTQLSQQNIEDIYDLLKAKRFPSLPV